MSKRETTMKVVLGERSVQELALGWLRYEHVRKMNARQFSELCRRNLTERIAFDDLIDAEIERRANEKT